MTSPRCSCCYDEEFDADFVRGELAAYRRKGPGRATRALAEALAGADAARGATVLDIGAGVGGLHHLLIERGAARATDVDASRPYLEAARVEAGRRGIADRVEFVAGDLVDLGPAVGSADLVGLDRVVCCYADGDALVSAAAARTRRRLGIVVPRDTALARLAIGLVNAKQWLTRSSFRMHAHRHDRIVAAARDQGLELVGSKGLGFWRLLVFRRPILTAGSR